METQLSFFFANDPKASAKPVKHLVKNTSGDVTEDRLNRSLLKHGSLKAQKVEANFEDMVPVLKTMSAEKACIELGFNCKRTLRVHLEVGAFTAYADPEALNKLYEANDFCIWSMQRDKSFQRQLKKLEKILKKPMTLRGFRIERGWKV